MVYYHVISDLPKYAGERFVVDDRHPNGVYRRVYVHRDRVKDIYRHPEKYEGTDLSHEVKVALRELALEKIRKEKYPRFPSRMASLYVSELFEEAERWAEYFAHLGRPTYGIARIRAAGPCYRGDASKCFDGTISEEENLRMAALYWDHEGNEEEHRPIVEILVDGEIEILEIIKDIHANI
ncbi:MAG: DUF2441 domain-containing protein [Clostridia bacterium]|nr:DUF2441 domain-containing protein [Clostridia bacterium]